MILNIQCFPIVGANKGTPRSQSDNAMFPPPPPDILEHSSGIDPNRPSSIYPPHAAKQQNNNEVCQNLIFFNREGSELSKINAL